MDNLLTYDFLFVQNSMCMVVLLAGRLVTRITFPSTPQPAHHASS